MFIIFKEHKINKKIVLLILSLLLVGVGFTGCGKKTMDPVVATEAFVNMFVLNEPSEKFKEVFADSEEYETLANKQVESFKVNLNTSLVDLGGGISEEQNQKLFEVFRDKVKEKSSYTVTLIEGNEQEATVNASIKGLII